MVLVSQGLVEYVTIALRGIALDAAALFGKARHLGAENFGLILGGLLAVLLGLILTSGSKKR